MKLQSKNTFLNWLCVLLCTSFLTGCVLMEVSFSISKTTASVNEMVTLTPEVRVVDDSGQWVTLTNADANTATKKELKDIKKEEKKFDRLEWDFGNGVTKTTFDVGPITTSYASAGTYTITLTVIDKWGGSIKSSKIITIEQIYVFNDQFEGSTLDLSKWTATAEYSPCCGSGHIATMDEAGGFLNISNPGGSCGSCGVPDGVFLTPKVPALTGDFEVVLSTQELQRLSADNTGTASSISLALSSNGSYYSGAPYIFIYIGGDVLDNTGVPGHKILAGSVDASGVYYPIQKDLTIGQYYSVLFRIRRATNKTYVAYRLSTEVAWTETEISATFPLANSLTPQVVVASFDSGGTTVNSCSKARLDYFTIR